MVAQGQWFYSYYLSCKNIACLGLFCSLRVMCNIFVTPKMIKKVIMNLDSSKASRSDCFPVLVLKNYEPELSYTLAEICNMCVKKSCFPDFWNVSSVVPVFQNVSLLSVVSKVYEKLVSNRFVDHLEKYGLFSDFQYGFRSSRSIPNLLTVLSD